MYVNGYQLRTMMMMIYYIITIVQEQIYVVKKKKDATLENKLFSKGYLNIHFPCALRPTFDPQGMQ